MEKEKDMQLSEHDRQRRNLVLEHNMWKTVLMICLPLALYQMMNQIFKVVDTRMAAHINSMAVSSVTYLSQINNMVSALGGGLAVGASLKISQAYGEGDFSLVKSRVSSLYAMSIFLGISVFLLLVPFHRGFLLLMNTPEEIITMGRVYFKVEVCSMSIRFFNNVYIAVERARGNTRRILRLNVEIILIKLALTAFFVYVLNGTMTMIAAATLAAELVMMFHAVKNTFLEDSVFSFSPKMVRWNKRVSLPMVVISVPVICEKLAFSLGKVLVNSMSTFYGALVIGALGVSNNIAGMVTAPFNGFQEGVSAIISQNRGAGNERRALDAFYKILVVNSCIGLCGFLLTGIAIRPVSRMFAEGNLQFANQIVDIYRYDMAGNLLLGLNASVMALLYGYGKTKIAMLINFARLFVFRVPVLWFLQNYTDVGERSVGLVMLISHIGVGAVSGLVGIHEVIMIKRKIKTEEACPRATQAEFDCGGEVSEKTCV